MAKVLSNGKAAQNSCPRLQPPTFPYQNDDGAEPVTTNFVQHRSTVLRRYGNFILKIGREIQLAMFIAGKMITDGTYLWVFRCAAVRLFKFATNCEQAMREQRFLRGIVLKDLAARMAEYQREREGAGGPKGPSTGLADAAPA